MLVTLNEHFSGIAQNYRDIRTTDSRPVSYITRHLNEFQTIKAADIGCGSGRYALKLFQYLGVKLYLYCIDCNEHMLTE